MNYEFYPWQKNDFNYLSNLIPNLPSAILFHGPKGLGTLELAYAFVAKLFCESKGNNFACGVCQACSIINNDSHPDLYVLKPNEDSTKKNKIITISEVREAIEFANLSSHMSNYKVILIQNTNFLTISSANSLLKVLEEPTKNTLFILLSNNLSQVLPTIKSRCHKYAISIPDRNIALGYLESRNIINGEFWLNYYNGCPLFDLEIDEMQLELLINTLCKPSVDNIFVTSNEFDGKNISFEFIVDFLSKWLADLATYKISNRLNYFSLYQQEIDVLLHRINIEKIFYLSDQLNFFAPWVNHPLNYKLHIENLLLNYQMAFVI